MFKNVFIRDDFRDRTLIIESSLSETHSQSAMIPRHNVENGVDITDHIQPKPLELTMDVALGEENPIKFYSGASEAQLLAGLQGNADSKAGKAWFTLLDFLNGGRWDEKNENRQYNPRGFFIQSELCPYENMFLESISTQRDKNTKCILFATLKFVRVRTVGTQTINVSNPDILKPESDLGDASTIQRSSTVEFLENASFTNNTDGEIAQLNLNVNSNIPETDTIYRITTSDNQVVYGTVLAGQRKVTNISDGELNNPNNLPVENGIIRNSADDLISR